MEKIVIVTPAFDKRDPNPNKNYGIGGCSLRFYLKGELGATQFVIFTNWHLPNIVKESGHKPWANWQPFPADVGYHSPKPMYDGQGIIDDNCELTGGVCYYDGSGLAAEKLYEKMLTGGSDAVWAELEEVYKDRFGELR